MSEGLSAAGRELPETGFVKQLRGAAAVAVPAGAAASLGSMLYAGRHNSSRILQFLFAAWVLSPFLAGMWANVVSQRWGVLTRAALHVVLLVVTLGSVAIYGETAFGHPRAKIGFVFLMVPFASWLLAATVVSVAAFISGRLSGRGGGA